MESNFAALKIRPGGPTGQQDEHGPAVNLIKKANCFLGYIRKNSASRSSEGISPLY